MSVPQDNEPIRIYTVHSQKGGVGKTSIALAIAGLASSQGFKSLIIDADMTGASLQDIPELSKQYPRDDKLTFNKLLLAKPADFASWTSSMPPKLENDGSKNFIDLFCREVNGSNNLFIIPSSSEPFDIQRVLPLITQEDHLHFFRHRMEDILTTAFCANFKVIIIDHSPGLFGFSKSMHQMILDLNSGANTNQRLKDLCKTFFLTNWHLLSQAVFLTSTESYDHRSLLYSLYYNITHQSGHKEDVDSATSLADCSKTFSVIFNKAPDSSDDLQSMAQLFEALKDSGTQSGSFSSFIDILEQKEKDTGVIFSPYISDFSMSDIVSICKAFTNTTADNVDKNGNPDSWQKWIDSIARKVQLTSTV